MSAKKNKGNRGSRSGGSAGLAGTGRGNAQAGSEAGGEGEAPGDRRGSTEAFQAGRRSLAYELVESGGLHSSRLGLEILYLLPDGFVEFYQELFHQALSVRDDSVMHGRSGGLDKAAGRMGMQLGSEERGPQSSGSGKKWKNTPMAIGSVEALRVKESLDKELMRLVAIAKRGLHEEREAKKMKAEEDFKRKLEKLGGQGPGAVLKAEPDEVVRGSSGKNGGPLTYRCSGSGCGRFRKQDWVFCPTCGTRSDVEPI